ncbi:YdiU family protein [Leeuwenhoekiella palythoae]|uniref:protein adenylyltransferase SelO n=1 Tax=Leeuwenhoekiella palythoae TaxID=573501 RepID=UPI001CE09331|nr:YdiU family protein [Leeuwenhoekiella palythoae]UBZ10300.1 YdiU family protein [Leeuwenhoekiella palythoae]
MQFNINNLFTEALPADPNFENSRRQVMQGYYSFVTPKETAAPQVLHVSDEMLNALGISEEEAESKEFLEVFTGNAVLPNTHPYAMLYGGHQFGHWAGQLGDGRAINLFEIDNDNKHWALQLKGAGETPYSRSADGLAVLRSSIREYLMSEAMHHLGIPTTRALSLALTGDSVLRDVMYDGNPAYEKGAVVCRVAPSFLRFGNYQIFTSRNDIEGLQKLVDFTIENYFPELGAPSKENYLKFFAEVSERTLEMIIHWQRVGFVHGVMNTDNMSILGLTIDYGPYGWLEGFDWGWTPNTTDRQHKRYRYGNQPNIGLWNLYQLANALYPLVEEADGFEEILDRYKEDYAKRSFQMMTDKLGLDAPEESDLQLIADLEECLQATETDMTIFFRKLADFKKDTSVDGLTLIWEAFYTAEEISEKTQNQWKHWFQAYATRLQQDQQSDEARKKAMNATNPKYVLRNYMAQLAIDAADKGDYSLIDELYQLLKKPYDDQPEYEKWFAKRPEWARDKVGCSMLSCSS